MELSCFCTAPFNLVNQSPPDITRNTKQGKIKVVKNVPNKLKNKHQHEVTKVTNGNQGNKQ